MFANMRISLPLVGKGRKPKFELHLKVYDLNNVPLVNGSSFIKWHLLHSMHAEHRGRTSKSPIYNHRVDYNYTKNVSSIRISIDKSNHLSECPIEFEILQEFGIAERVTLGFIRLNLSEYIEESEAFVKEGGQSPPQKRRSNSVSTTATGLDVRSEKTVEDGIVRRYLMQDSRINCTLRVGVLMVQVDGDRNFVAPALRTAPMFGGIAGLIPPEQIEDDTNQLPSISKPRDASEIQDLYRITLAASWHSQPSEPPADECIEDIFSGGNGWRTKRLSQHHHDTDSEEEANHGTLRPSDFRQHAQRHQRASHRRTTSASSDKSISTVKGQNSRAGPIFTTRRSRPDRDDYNSAARESRYREEEESARGRPESFVSMTTPLGSDGSGGGGGQRRLKEIKEADVREDMVAWAMPSSAVTT